MFSKNYNIIFKYRGDLENWYVRCFISCTPGFKSIKNNCIFLSV